MKRTLAAATTILTALALTSTAMAEDVALRQINQDEFSSLVVGNTSDKVQAGRKVFSTDSLWDGKLWSAWACDEVDDAWISVDFPVARYVTQVQILTGFAADGKKWKASARPRTIQIIHDNGVQTVKLQDSRALQTLRFFEEPIVSAHLKIKVVDTYGAGPIAISELKVYEPEDVFALKPELRQEIVDNFEALTDPARREAAESRLVAIGPPAGPWLSVGLQGDDPAVRTAVTRIFTRTGQATGVAPVTAAARRVSTIEGSHAVAAEQEFLRTALAYLAQQRATSGVRVALSLYKSDDWRAAMPADIMNTLASCGHPDALPALVQAVEGDDDSIAAAAVPGFGRLGYPGGMALKKLARHDSTRVRLRAAEAVGHFTDGRAWDAAKELVGDAEPTVRAQVYRSMEQNVRPMWVKLLETGVADPEVKVRAAAVKSLGSYPQAETRALAVKATRDEHPAVRRAAVLALESQGETALPQLVGLVPRAENPHADVRREATRAVVRQGKRHAPRLTELLTEKLATDDRADGQAIAHLLAACGQHGTSALFDLLESRDTRRSFHARRALEARPADAVPFIRTRLASGTDDQSPTNISRMLSVLGATGDPKNIDLVGALMKDRRARVRADATQTAGRLPGEKSTGLLMTALGDEWRDVREYAVSALGERKERRAVPFLIKMIRDKDEIMLRAVWALGEIGDAKALAVLHELRDHERSTVRQYVCQALGKIGRPESLGVLMDLVDDDDELVRFQAARAVDRLN